MDFGTNRWRLYAALAGLGLAGIGCSADNKPQPPAVNSRVQLLAFTGTNACQDLEQYIEDTAVRDMRNTLESYRDETYSWGRGGPFFGEDAAGTPTASAAGAAKSTPTDYTTTNTQVSGVDEADFVKNDGTRIFALSGQTLYASRSWPATDLAVRGTLKIEGYPREMFLEGTDKAVVFSSIYSWYPLSNAAGDRCDSLDCGFESSNTVKITVVDVSDLSNLRVTHEYKLPGHYNSARKVGSSVRMVISDDFNFPSSVQYWWPEVAKVACGTRYKGRRTDEFNKLIVENEKPIRAQTLAEWVPAGKLTINGATSTVPHECSAFQTRERAHAAGHGLGRHAQPREPDAHRPVHHHRRAR